MNRLIRMWNQNRLEFIAGVIIIISIFVVIRLLNAYYAGQSKKEGEKTPIESINSAEEINQVQIDRQPIDEITGDSEISKTASDTNIKVMKTFIQYCNDKNAEAAYNMLTTECKKILFPTLDEFTQGYIQNYFQTKRGLDYELWKSRGGSYTYKITLLNDALAEGSFNSSNSYKDYYTIEAQDGTWKLNLGGLIRYTETNKTVEKDGISWNVIGKEIYKDYEIYTVRVSNHSGKTVMLDTLQTNKSIFSTGSNGTTYSAISNEIPRASLILKNYGSSTLRIKFNKIYNSITTNKITFTNVILDYDSYTQNEAEQEFIQVEISIE